MKYGFLMVSMLTLPANGNVGESSELAYPPMHIFRLPSIINTVDMYWSGRKITDNKRKSLATIRFAAVCLFFCYNLMSRHLSNAIWRWDDVSCRFHCQTTWFYFFFHNLKMISFHHGKVKVLIFGEHSWVMQQKCSKLCVCEDGYWDLMFMGSNGTFPTNDKTCKPHFWIKLSCCSRRRNFTTRGGSTRNDDDGQQSAIRTRRNLLCHDSKLTWGIAESKEKT